jgi:phosphate transport system protein
MAPTKIPFDLPGMGQKVRQMVTNSLDALVNLDDEVAGEVCRMDDDVDEINREMYSKVKESILESPENVEPLIHLLSISRHLERIADHATNIAQDIIYLIRGDIIRHKAAELT